MLPRLTKLFSVSQNVNLARNVFNELDQKLPPAIKQELIKTLDMALNQKQSVENQYDKRLAACDTVIYYLGLNHELAHDIHGVKRIYGNSLAKYNSKLCVRLKKLLGLA